MKFKEQDLKVLKFITNITKLVLIKKEMTGKNEYGSVAFEYKMQSDVSLPFAIYDLGHFLNVVNEYPDANIKVDENKLIISSDKVKVKYATFFEDSVPLPNIKNVLEDLEPDKVFELSEEEINQIIKNCKILNNDIIEFGNGKIKTFTKTDTTTHNFEMEREDIDVDSFYINFNDFILYKGDYVVYYYEGKLIELVHKDINDLKIYIALADYEG